MNDNDQIVWVSTVHDLAGPIRFIAGVFGSHFDAVNAIEKHAGRLEWQIVEQPGAPGFYKALISALLDEVDLSVAIYPMRAGQLFGSAFFEDNATLVAEVAADNAPFEDA